MGAPGNQLQWKAAWTLTPAVEQQPAVGAEQRQQEAALLKTKPNKNAGACPHVCTYTVVLGPPANLAVVLAVGVPRGGRTVTV